MARALKPLGTHSHACPDCCDTFICGCRNKNDDPRCNSCIGHRGDSVLAHGRRPRPCCLTQSRLPRKDEVVTYRLAGSQPWWFCAECKRAFNYQPTESFDEQDHNAGASWVTGRARRHATPPTAGSSASE